MWLSPRATVARALPAISSEGMAKKTAAMDAAETFSWRDNGRNAHARTKPQPPKTHSTRSIGAEPVNEP
jgi:hypothetical protein